VEFFFEGWCFNGGDTVYVYLIDDTLGTAIGLPNPSSVQAGPDNGTLLPGAISGGVFAMNLGMPATDHAHFLAVDPLIGVARSSCFTLAGTGC
jgi:hypothetical protein